MTPTLDPAAEIAELNARIARIRAEVERKAAAEAAAMGGTPAVPVAAVKAEPGPAGSDDEDMFDDVPV
jgi:hypothetical protein